MPNLLLLLLIALGVIIGIAVLVIAIVLLLVEMGWGFFRPSNNIEYPILRGGILDHTIRGGVDYGPERDSWGKMEEHSPSESWLWCQFGIRYFGFPGIYSIGEVIVNYPIQFRSTSGNPHPADTVAPGFDVRHNYKLVLDDVDFLGGIPIRLFFNLFLKLVRTDKAWDQNKRFLDPIGLYIDGTIGQKALSVDAFKFVGQTLEAAANEEEEEETSKGIRDAMCKACMNLNLNVSQDEDHPVRLADICGYEIETISYEGLEPTEASKGWFEQLKKQNEAFILLATAKTTAEAVAETARGVADKTKIEGRAQAAMIIAKGKAQADADLLLATAKAAGLKLEKEALGDSLMGTQMWAQSIEKAGIKMLLTGGNSNGIPPVIIQAPSIGPEPAATPPPPATP